MGKRSSCKKPGFFIHNTCIVDEGVVLGCGTQIWCFSHILKNCRIGDDCKIGQNVVIGPDVTIGNNVKIQNNVSVYPGVTLEDDVFCGPSMVFTNIINPRSAIPRNNKEFYKKTLVSKGATIGANATIVCGNTIGQYAFVGAGSVVTRDIPDFALVYGNPARFKGWVCECGLKLVFKGSNSLCPVCRRAYVKSGSKVKLTG